MEKTSVDPNPAVIDFDDEMGKGLTKVKILVFMVLFSPFFSTAFIYLAFSDFNLLYLIPTLGALGITALILQHYEKSTTPDNDSFDHLR